MVAERGDILEQLDRHLASPCLTWLLGAGISHGAQIPLMYPLTAHVTKLLKDTDHGRLLERLQQELPDGAHIEHILSHLGDYAALSERSKSKTVSISGDNVAQSAIENTHNAVLKCISTTVRWGYRPGTDSSLEEVGSYGNPIISVDGHRAFVEALFRTAQAGLQERRQAVRLFTTNYDTLIEDALALACIPYWDGFDGGGVAFRSHRFGQDEPDRGYRAHVVKLHGSIDWHLGSDGKIWRVRDGDNYPASRGQVLIHPQSTKYVATQRDPFASQFELFRRALSNTADNVLGVCGFSFGDDHINQEMELALERPGCKATLLAFCQEGENLPLSLDAWRKSEWGERVYVVTENGIYVGKEGPFHPPKNPKGHDWWTFNGVTDLLRNGAEGRA